MAFKDIIDIIIPPVTIPDTNYEEHDKIKDRTDKRLQQFPNYKKLKGASGLDSINIKYGTYRCTGINSDGESLCDFYQTRKRKSGFRIHGGVDLGYSGTCRDINYILPGVYSPVDGTVIKTGGSENSVHILDSDKKYVHIIRHLFSIEYKFLTEKIKKQMDDIKNENRKNNIKIKPERFLVMPNYLLADVEVSIKKGDLVGYMGGTGEEKLNDYSPHVHYEIRKYKEDILIDPVTFWNNNKEEKYFSFINSKTFLKKDSASVIKRGSGKSETLTGGESDDILQGFHGNDTLEGGKGVDAYIFGVLGSGKGSINDGKDTIIDSDGFGQVIISSCQIGLNVEKVSENIYKETIGDLKIDYELKQDTEDKTKKDLIVKYGNGGEIKIKDFYENKLMIKLQNSKEKIENNKEEENEKSKEETEEKRKRLHDYLEKIDPSSKIGLRVCSGAELMCIAGNKSCKIDGNNGVLINGKEVITVDENSKKNIAGFSSCKFKKNDPCTFSPAGEWIGTDSKYLVNKKATVIDKSILICSVGGVIKVNDAGQSDVWYGIAPVIMKKIEEETGREIKKAEDKLNGAEKKEDKKQVKNNYKIAEKTKFEFGHGKEKIYIDIVRTTEKEDVIFGEIYFYGEKLGESVEKKHKLDNCAEQKIEYKAEREKNIFCLSDGNKLYSGIRIEDLTENGIMVGKESLKDRKTYSVLRGNIMDKLNFKIQEELEKIGTDEKSVEFVIRVS